jgi:radical SAM superfamily enzyme with C-terminal helix-hairpin-helix motif
MAKKNTVPSVSTDKFFFDDMSHEEFVARYQANQAEIAYLRDENNKIHYLDIDRKKADRLNKSAAKIAALQAQIAGLTQSADKVETTAVTSEELAM